MKSPNSDDIKTEMEVTFNYWNYFVKLILQP